VQRNAMQVWEKRASFLDLLAGDADVTKYLSRKELAALFDLGYHTKHVNTIFKRVFGSEKAKTGAKPGSRVASSSAGNNPGRKRAKVK
jgi:Holliday junction resolvasome RuvABC DNA-binding subunit